MSVFKQSHLVFCVLLCAAWACACTADRSPGAKNASEAGRSKKVEWPQFGGPKGDFRLDGPGFSDAWPSEGPPLIWEHEVGPGYSGVVVGNGIVVAMYLQDEENMVVALDATDGSRRWNASFPAGVRRANQTQFGRGPNATPLIFDGKVFCLGYGGALFALDLETGETLWSVNLIDNLGGDVLSFGYSASPIEVDGNVVVLVGGNQHAVAALDPERGTVVWSSQPGSVSYATPIVIEAVGQRQLLYFSSDELISLNPADGERLWSFPVTNEYQNNATQPIWDPEEGMLWVATQADGGTRGLRLTPGTDGNPVSVEEVWFNNQIRIHFWNAVRIGHHVYASIGGQAYVLACVDLRTGEILWKERGFSQANFLRSGEDTILLDENGELARVDLSPEGLKLLSQVSLGDEVTWTAPALVGTRLYVRDQKRLRAFDLL